LISTNHTNENFEFYIDEERTVLIENPEDYENTQSPFNQSVFVKIITDQDCYRESRIDLKIGASLIDENFMEKYSTCETSAVESQDGIELWNSEIFSQINTKLIASDTKFTDQNITISYYSSEEDALTKSNKIDFENASFSYSNKTANVQEIWALVENNDLDTVSCLGLKQVATLYVEPRPIANDVTIDRQCDGDSPDDLDSQDGKYPFDVSLIESQVILDQTDVSVSYFNEDGTEIQNFGQSLFLTESQTITIIVEKEPSYPDITNPNGLCYDETTLEFIVDDSPEAYPVIIAPHCDGDDGGIDNDGYDTFDTSEVITTILTNPETGVTQDITKLEIEFTFVDENGNTITDSQLPNPFVTATQTVTFTVENPLNTNCIITDEIDFVVNPLPEFTVDDDTIVCLNLPAIPIGVTSSEAEYTYSWVHEDLNGNSSPFPSTEDTIFVGVGGTYYVTATTTDGTNCSRTLSINVEESIIATITLDDITVKDLTNDNNNTITIDPTNLGIGDYEYAIDDPSGPYQDEPFFEQVRPGIHTIYVRDKNNCGIAQIDVSVIGYKKFFTPNNDGIHDTWRILGIREDFQPNSKVYIFDRYGKLLKELDPVGEGWDGTFIGRPMPQSDYWFRVFLEDGREFKGHFSLVRGFD
jgi:gliding motility-associated-like protein